MDESKQRGKRLEVIQTGRQKIETKTKTKTKLLDHKPRRVLGLFGMPAKAETYPSTCDYDRGCVGGW